MNKKLIFDALLAAYSNHSTLGKKGKEIISDEHDTVQNNLRADIESEQKMFDVIKPDSYWGEEIGREEKEIGDFWVLDGIDGTANYSEKTNWSYGAMIAGADFSDPSYSDFKVAGVGMFEEGFALVAEKGGGVFVCDFKSKKEIKLSKFDQSVEFDEEKILSDNYYQEAKDILGRWQDIWPRTGSTAASIVAIAIREIVKDKKYSIMNKCWQGLFDVTRKGNLEQPILYLVLSELGGVMIDKNKDDIGPYKFKTWGQNENERIPVISAISKTVAKKILSKLKKLN